MPSRIKIICFILAALVFPRLCHAQKAAIVNLEKVIQALPETKIAQDKLDSSISYLQRIHEILADSVETIQMQPHDGPYSAEIKLSYLQRLAAAQDNLELFEKEANEGLKDFRQKLYDPLAGTAKTLSTKVAKAYGYNALVTTKKGDHAVLYSVIPPTDITDIVVEEIKKHTKK